MSTMTNEQVPTEEYSSSRHSTPNSSGGERQFQYGSNTNIERGSSQNSRTSSVAESTGINTEGFSNFTEVLQHLQTAWNNHNNIHEGSRRLPSDETVPAHYSKGHSQQHQHHQYTGHHYNNRRTGGGNGNYSRGYNHTGNNDGYWNSKSNRYPSHRTVNSLMSNSNNYQQQSQPSPPTQRRQGDIQQQQQQQQYHHNEQSYYKKTRTDHDRRSNGYHSQHSSNIPSSTSSDLSSTQSFPNNINTYNR